MPELPEVRMVVKFLKENLTGKTINEFSLYYNPLLVNLKTTNNVSLEIEQWKKNLHQEKITDVFAHGKYIIFQLTNFEMISHLRMEGKWVIEKPEIYAYSENLVEAQFSFASQPEVLRYYDSRRFGTLELLNKDQWDKTPAIAKLGYEPFNKLATAQWLFSKLQRSRKAIKTVLLDQTIILGLGNIYVNEVLFSAKIHPERSANEVSLEEADQILQASKKILNDSIAVGGTTIHSFSTGNKVSGRYQDYLQVHGRAQQNCYACGSKILKIVVGGRGTYFCLSCQAK